VTEVREFQITSLGFERPQLARGEEIIAVPTLVRRPPAPIKKLIGELSDTERVLVGLQLLMPEGW
jgi:circadian clock protein KaiB